MKKNALLGITIFIIICSGCVNAIKINYSQNPKTNFENLGTDQWTVMIYLDGDNDLEYMLKNSIGWLKSYEYSEQINIVAQFDSYSIFDGIRRYEVNESGAQIVDTIDEKSMGDKETLVEFVNWAIISNYSAERYCLVLSDHGVGWRNGFLKDDTDKQNNKSDYLSIFELKDAMNEIKTELGKTIDLVVFDACQMGMIEVYYQIKDSVKICVGTSGMIGGNLGPGNARGGCPYHCILPDLHSNPSCDAVTLASYFVDGYNQYYRSKYNIEVYDIEYLSTIVIEKLDEFSIELNNKYSKYKRKINNAIEETTSYNVIADDGDVYITHHKNLHSFTMKLINTIPDEQIKEKAEELRAALWDCKLYSSGYPGLSIYLPTNNWKFPYDPSYKYLDLCKDTNWIDFVYNAPRTKSKSLFPNPIINSIIIDFLKSLKFT
jgi:hypothetical protein